MKKRPLVLNITNYVAMNISANILLAAGASPLMSFYPAEMEDLVALSDGLVVNIGCLDDQLAEGARRAAAAALRRGIPWVLDPVGVGASAARKALCRELVEQFRPAIIRCNPSEAAALAALLCGAAGKVSGADGGVEEAAAGGKVEVGGAAAVPASAAGRGADSTIDSVEALDAAKALAARYGAVVCISGSTDYITDGTAVLTVEGGSPLMTRVTAMGCSASALVAAFAACAVTPGATSGSGSGSGNGSDSDSGSGSGNGNGNGNGELLRATWQAMSLMSAAGEEAARRTSLPGSFETAFIDAVSLLSHRDCGGQPASQQSDDEQPACHGRPDGGRMRDLLKLYLVTDRGLAGGRNIAEIVREAALGGVTMVQLREKDISTREFIALAKEILAILRPLGIPLIINDRVDVAVCSGADGVHLGQSDMPCAEARRLLGPGKIIGLSVENMDQVLEAGREDVDYIGVSPVFATPTKTDTAAPFGLSGLREAAGISRHPAVAIGGMNASTAEAVMQAGADGIAVVSAIVCAPDPRAASAQLLDIVNNGIAQRNR